MKTLVIFLLFISFSTKAQEYTFTVYFDFGKHTLNEGEKARLIAFKNNLSDTVIIKSITGFTDTVSSSKFNLALAQRRVETIIRYFENTPILEKKYNGKKEALNSKEYVAREYRKVMIHLVKFSEPTTQFSSQQPDVLPKITAVPRIEDEKVIEQSIRSFFNDTKSEVFNYDLSILFYNNSAVPLPESEPELLDLWNVMREHKNLDIVIHGHVCCSDNYEISLARAKTVYNYLIEGGINFRRMKYIGHSNSQPKISPEITEEDMKLNRRVTIEFIKK